MTIVNGADRPLSAGNLPNVGNTLPSWAQSMMFIRIVKSSDGYENVETPTPVAFMGVIQPLTDRQLLVKPEGQRSWKWFWLHADPSLTLNLDEVVDYNGVKTRVMSTKDFGVYGYIEYHLCQDWEGSGP